ncbi:CRISPR-associated endoribonuclease Cas6 [Acetobacteroides hydrogenigenes]|uniref:CRISPR-associated endoribonuclease Cas6 n=1 Tax=Acetobacteroides hydrogenigenes TaxID=979970 RepID=A0A4R2EMA9_9BACT|nr:CRISPR-associated endoribonuclease Cas6 [Acetobacteroides hydrogenigenes]TCN67594.1 CRISPR-associated endoribonuclease Cas6 [Acetobacteroides hydrogenigenes]
MRFRLKLQVDHNFGSILPLNYQLEVSRLIYDILTEDSYNFKKWLNYNDIPYKNHSPFFNFSNIIVVDRKIYGDRMLILSDTIELTISFLYNCCTEEFVYYAFENLIFKLGDSASKIRLKVVGIEKLFSPKFSNKMQFIARSPIVLRSYGNSRYVNFLSPVDTDYNELFAKNLIDKYQKYTDYPLEDHNIYTSIELLTEPKSKLLGINGQQRELVKGYLYRFTIEAPKELLEVGYKIGFGDKNHLGFGFCDILYATDKKLTPILDMNGEVASPLKKASAQLD